MLAGDSRVSVQYGALRSLVDQAYRAPNEAVRNLIFRRLAEHSHLLRSTPALASEFERVLEVSDPPPGWAEAASVVLESFLEAELDPGEQERWRRLSAELRLNWTVPTR